MQKNVIGSKLMNLRVEAGYSIKEIALYVGEDETKVQAWENGEKEPGIYQLHVLSHLYGISIDEVMHEVRPSDMVAAAVQEKYLHEAWMNRMCKGA